MIDEKSRKNATLIGLVAVLIWGISVPAMKFFQQQFGLFVFTALAFGIGGMFGIITNLLQGKGLLEPKLLGERALYLQWICFVLHESLLAIAVFLVARENLPFIVLLNYLWPTAVIFCSIYIAGVPVTRRWAIGLGSAVVISSFAVELIGRRGVDVPIISGSQDGLAYLLAFFGAVAWGLYSALSRRDSKITGEGKMVPFFQLTLGVAALIPAAIGPDYGGPVSEWRWTPILLFYCLLQFVAYLTWDYGVRRGNVVYVSLGADLIPWISLCATAMIVDVTIPVTTIVAAVILVAGAVLTRYGTLPAKESYS